jgi:acetylornithine deacetylase
MKGGLAAVVSAMAAVNAEQPHLPMTLVVTVDEELGAKGVRHYVANEPVGTYRACIVAEPTNLVTITACRGAMNLRVDIEGASAHAGKPDEGANAIVAATDVIAAIEADDARLRDRPHPVLGSGNWSVGTVEGGHGTSIVADRCTLTVDRRILPEEDPFAILDNLLTDARERIRAGARAGAERIRVTGEVEMVMPGFETDPESDLVARVVRAVKDAGGAGETGVWTAACEGGFVHRHHGIDVLVFGPGDLTTQAHQPDEHVLVSDLHLAARAYALLAVRAALAGTQGIMPKS